ncbi:hypothetical protein EPO05_04505 [Patescibacteria group bacterium]|nr:MAG: hypothetical protein EPO05_04505 [Patescibacteria group bacterium]
MGKKGELVQSVLDILQTLVKIERVQDSISPEAEAAMRRDFETGNYVQCIKRIRANFNMRVPLKAEYVGDGKLPLPGRPVGSPAVVYLPAYMPLFGTEQFNSLLITMRINRLLLTTRYELFVTAVAHELSHVLLYGLHHPLCESEVATDLLPMLFGFAEIRRRIYDWDAVDRLGYLKRSQFKAAYHWVRACQPRTPPEQRAESLKKLIRYQNEE